MQHATLTKVRVAMVRLGLSITNMAELVGVSSSYLQACLGGTRRLSPLRIVVACRAVGLDFTLAAAVLEEALGGTKFLRISRASRDYECTYCRSEILRGNEYVRLGGFVPNAQTPPSVTAVQHFCRSCSVRAGWLQQPSGFLTTKDSQLLLPFAQHVKPTHVQLIDISSPLASRILANPVDLFRLNPSQFEELVLDRLCAMGLHAKPVGGGIYRRDGGIDIIFTPPRTFPFPFIGAVQVKHRRHPSRSVGPQPVRELAGVLAAHRFFAAGIIVTNTSFTPDAMDFASRCQPLLRLRGFHDLMRWVADNFVDDAEWRELPTRVQLCEGISIDLA